ncbi:hypothetical protein IX318_000365 [Porphyromonas levii]|nr:hypothetical protein [Porphyromonas levii]MBR8714527.1 hypothetical protein [Porphyromonas levii]MBR8727068.1 hypothetical protein [Porphyromonas levii]MBR8735467.1 hypothetical protein [Porphyromonas levii]MBR8777432.1 hypothetical protein [Porphyromonas levii]
MYSSLSFFLSLSFEQTGYPPPVDKVSGMAPRRSQFHQPMFAVPGVQREGLPHKEGGRCRAEADTYPLVDADHVEDDEQDEESQQTSAEDEEVLSLQALELYRTADTLVYRVFSHTLLY